MKCPARKVSSRDMKFLTENITMNSRLRARSPPKKVPNTPERKKKTAKVVAKEEILSTKPIKFETMQKLPTQENKENDEKLGNNLSSFTNSNNRNKHPSNSEKMMRCALKNKITNIASTWQCPNKKNHHLKLGICKICKCKEADLIVMDTHKFRITEETPSYILRNGITVKPAHMSFLEVKPGCTSSYRSSNNSTIIGMVYQGEGTFTYKHNHIVRQHKEKSFFSIAPNTYYRFKNTSRNIPLKIFLTFSQK